MSESRRIAEVMDRELGGGALARAAIAGELPAELFAQAPRTIAGWQERCTAVRDELAGRDWLSDLVPALQATGVAQRRLERTARDGGVVVTTGQQPGLFGGPAYTWYKAISALTLADEIERVTGIPTAPIFWAATDDADLVEASVTYVTVGGIVQELRMDAKGDAGRAMAAVPLPDVAEQLAMLRAAGGSAAFPEPLAIAAAAYTPGKTIGSAYVSLLRAMLEPLGIAVLDAAHPAVSAAAMPTLRSALRNAESVAAALRARTLELESRSFRPQVQDVPHLSLVFGTQDGVRRRIRVNAAADVADAETQLGPNVLLRPIVERQILPTVAYVAGPAEIAYFAQITAITTALGLSEPVAVPRWSATIIEPDVRSALESLGLTVAGLADPHAAETRIAREDIAPAVRDSIGALRRSVVQAVDELRGRASVADVSDRVPSAFGARLERQIARLERRYAAAVKHSDNERVRRLRTARTSLYPNDAPQERVLNLLPILARYGPQLRDALIAAARRHAVRTVGGADVPPRRVENG